ncbi:hypothetical protein ACFE04_000207 [Oxalis oulophora]
MGEKKGEANGDGGITAVYKTDLHCEGCAKKVKRAIKNYEGVGSVKTDCSANKVTVGGKFDPVKVKERLEEKLKKKIEIVSPEPKKADGNNKKPEDNNKKGDEKKEKEKGKEKEKEKDGEKKKGEEKKKDDAKKSPPPPKESTLDLKTRLHCEGCIQKIKKVVTKFKGVNSVSFDASKDLIMVKGTMDPKALVPFLNEKLKRPVEVVVPAKKDEGKKEKEGGGGGGDKKEKEGGGGEKKEGGGDKKEGGGKGGGDKKEKGGGGGDGATKDVAGGSGTKVEINKMDHYGYAYPQEPSYWYGGQSYGQNYPMAPVAESMYGQNYAMAPVAERMYGQNYAMAPVDSHYTNHYQYHPQGGYANANIVPHGYVNNHYGYVDDNRAPQMFSDENPNACSLM